MNSEMMLNIVIIGFFSLMMIWETFYRFDLDVGSELYTPERYRPFIPGYFLPLYLFTLIVISGGIIGVQKTTEHMLSLCFGVFLHICVYYFFLMLLLPILRKYISARACALLWMIPNYLYLMQNSFLAKQSPIWVICAPNNVVKIICIIWAIGFIAIFLTKIISHLSFRSQLLKDTIKITDPEILQLWDEELEKSGLEKKRYPLVISPHCKTPLSIGLFHKTITVVLPNRHYSLEELQFIFRHELVHIGREDAWAKFFLAFCTAMCWFNPLMWVAMKKSAEDLELSCDETVLLNQSEEKRKMYAHLILDTASDQRGFTTCLSSSAKAMHYRLKNIVKPKKRFTGSICVGLLTFALFMTCGYVSLAYNESTGATLVYLNQNPQSYTIDHITMYEDEYNTIYDFVNEEGFHQYISNLSMWELTGNYSFTDSEHELTFIFDTPKGTLSIVLYDEIIKIVPLYGENRHTSYYYIPDGIDWDKINEYIIGYPALNIEIITKDDNISRQTNASLIHVDIQDMEMYHLDPIGESSGFYGFNPIEINFYFSYDQLIDYSITVESWDYLSSNTIHSNELKEPFKLKSPEFPAHYTIDATFLDKNQNIIKAQFYFDIGDV